jgi:CHRD domain
LVKVKGNRVSFAVNFKNTAPLTLGHIHQGKAGVNGPVKVNLFTTALPDTVSAAAGRTAVEDAAVIKGIRSNPAGFYVNLHSAEFPGGAVRGQLQPLRGRVDLLSLLKGGQFRAIMDAEQEVQKPNGPKVGDPDGFASAFVRARGDKLGYSVAWVGTGAPTKLHIHQGKRGVNGEVKVDLINVTVPDTIFAISGTKTGVDPTVTRQIRQQPKGFYVNLHTAEFTDGAVRGQLFR